MLFISLFMVGAQLIASDVFDRLTEAYAEFGDERYMIDEEITQASHVLQAAYFAKTAGAPEEVVVGLLFHDIGQIAEQEHVGEVAYLHKNHAEMGELWLKRHEFPSFVSDWVARHTIAKLVHCIDNPDYYEKLSKASKDSYHYQKEKYSDEVLARFRAHPNAADFLAMRLCDDMAKVVGFEPPGFFSYEGMIKSVLSGSRTPASNPHWRSTLRRYYSAMVENREAFEERVRLNQLSQSSGHQNRPTQEQ